MQQLCCILWTRAQAHAQQPPILRKHVSSFTVELIEFNCTSVVLSIELRTVPICPAVGR